MVRALFVALVLSAGVAFAGLDCTSNNNPTGVYRDSVTGDDLHGCISAQTGLNGFGAYDDFQMEWDITSSGGVYTYNYLFQDIGSGNEIRQISHLLLGISSTCTSITNSSTAGSNCIWNTSWDPAGNENGQPATYLESNGNPGMPGSLYSFKITPAAATSYQFSFDTYRAPVWQNVYVKDGGGTGADAIVAKNRGFGVTTGSSYYIAAPDTISFDSGVPEPSAYVVLGLGLSWLFLVVSRRRKTTA